MIHRRWRCRLRDGMTHGMRLHVALSWPSNLVFASLESVGRTMMVSNKFFQLISNHHMG